MFQARLSISDDSVSVLVTQPSDTEDADRESYNSAYRQCLGHLMATPPREFDVEVTGRAFAPGAEVTIQRSLLQKLPLIHDIASNTSAKDAEDKEGSESETSHRQDADIMLPCSVWGLASLLLLLEGRVAVKELFEGDRSANDPSLPAQTLEVRITCW